MLIALGVMALGVPFVFGLFCLSRLDPSNKCADILPLTD